MLDPEMCPVCSVNPVGYGECPISKEERLQVDEYLEPIDCPCCDECREQCYD